MVETRLSRREFLKLLGLGATGLALSTFGFNSLLNFSKMQNGGKVTAQSAGSWDPTINQPLQTSAIHAALISGGRVFWLSGSDNYTPWADGPFYHGIWNPDGSFGSTNTLGEDLFCCGMSMLANGNVLLAGGTLEYDSQTLNGKWHGASYAYEVDWSSGSVGNRTQMAHGRWYPTQITLPDGKVCVVQGLDEYGTNSRLVEFYDPQTRQWQIKLDPSGTVTYCVGTGAEAYYPDAGKTCYGPGAAPFLTLYPRMHLMPSGLIASVGAGVDDRVYEPSTGKWVFRGATIVRHYGTSVLLPLENTDTEKGKILVCGGSTPTATDDATKVAEIATPSGTNGLARRNTQSMNYARKHLNPVILPTGQIVIFGGNLRGAQSPVLYPEMFDPVSETWNLLPAATVPRMYHGLALLLQDGRVWTAGTTPNAQTKEIRVEIFKPWYITETRPIISDGITGGAYGGTITIPTQNAADVNKVSLLRVSATTHHYNTDQRLIWLQITSKTSSNVTVKAPINNKLAPPGYYLVHVLNAAGVPSTGKFIKIPGSADLPSDTTIPTVAITSPANSATISGPSTGVTVNVAGTASDNSGGSGIQKVEVQVGSANQFKLANPGAPGDWSTWSASDIVTTEGSQTITARATDNAGNMNNATITVTVAFSAPSDTTIPTVAITSPANSATISGPSTGVTVNVAGTASDNSGGSGIQKVEVQVGSANQFKLATPAGPGGSQDWSTWSASDIVTTEGSHTITARATDNAGNTNNATITVTVAFSAPSDTTIPTVAITSPANSATISGPSTGVTVNVAGTASDNSGGSGIQKVEVQVGSANQFKLATPAGPGGSQDWSTWSASDIVTTEGSQTITARATDNAGNMNNATITVTVAFSVSGGTYTSIYSVTGANNYGALNTGGLKRAGEYMHKSTTFNSALIGQSVKRVNVILRRAGSPTGTISVVVRRFSDDSIVHTFGTIDASTLTANDKTFTLESTSSYTIAANDRILVEWGGTSSSNDQVRVKKNGNDASGGLDGQNTKWVQYQTSYVIQGNYDLAGEWFKLT